MKKLKQYIIYVYLKVAIFFAKAWLKIKSAIVMRLLKMRARLRISSLRKAIGDADKDKSKTGRKNMVVFNDHNGQYEAITKRLLKTAAKSGKNKSNKAHTEGRLKMMKNRKQRLLDHDRVKQIEEKSLYVTK